MKMPNKNDGRVWQWFLEILGEEVNEISWRQAFHLENAFGEYMCADGEIHRLCKCDKELLEMIKRKATHNNLKIRTWKRRGRDGRIVLDQGRPSKFIRGQRLVKKLAQRARQFADIAR